MDDPRSAAFRVFNEIGIINQLATAILARRLPDGLHPSQFSLLGNLVRLGDGKTPAMLAAAFQVPKPSMTNTLMQLEKRALITVETHPDDLRKKVVYLTDAGREVYRGVIAAMDAPLRDVIGQVEGVTDMLPTLEQLRRVLDDNRDV
ncbi:MarR family winged helix-turn-helix transcriptional regulator [Gymnodinialimonas sp.]